MSAGNDYVGAWRSDDKLQGFLEFDITLPAEVFAVGTDIMNSATFFLAADRTYTATLSTGDVFSNIFASKPPTRSFVGFCFDNPDHVAHAHSTHYFRDARQLRLYDHRLRARAEFVGVSWRWDSCVIRIGEEGKL